MSVANASPTGRSHQVMSGANASPARSASAAARSLKKGRSHQVMSGANASPTRSASATARSLNKRRSHQVIRRILLHIAVASILAGSLPALQAQDQTPAKWTPARTPDGHPDMQGMWARRGAAMAEANPPKTPLSEFGSTGQPYPTVFNTGVSTPQAASALANRPAGVIEPADRVLPWRPEADAARREFLSHMIPPASLKYVEASARCVPPGLLGGDDRHPYQIVQRPGSFVLMYEYNHVTRVIYTDGRPHVGSNIQLYMGDSIGRWEGDTLVVDTTNFNDKTSFSQTIPFHSDALHTVERFTMVDPYIIDYQITIEDPKMFTAPIRIAGTFAAAAKGSELMEFACAEGSQTLPNIFGFGLFPGQ